MIVKYTVTVIIIGISFFSGGQHETKNNHRAWQKAVAVPVTTASSIPKGLQKLLLAYPGQFIGAKNNVLIWPDSVEMRFDDGITNKSFQALLDNADLEDQVCSMTYLRNNFSVPAKNSDAGRVRYEPFFLKMYGSTEQQVRANLVEITWLPKHVNKKIRVSKINDVAGKLKKISEELDQYPELSKYLQNPGGTFTWRKISGTNRLSTHSFGITIDINVAWSNYWQWDNPAWKKKGENIDLVYKNRIPLKIVEVFEKYGFIWGGKWYHYDTMHFEYRPELL